MPQGSTRNILPWLTLSTEALLPVGGAVASGNAPTASFPIAVGPAVAGGVAVTARVTIPTGGAFARGVSIIDLTPVAAILTVTDTYPEDDVAA